MPRALSLLSDLGTPPPGSVRLNDHPRNSSEGTPSPVVFCTRCVEASRSCCPRRQRSRSLNNAGSICPRRSSVGQSGLRVRLAAARVQPDALPSRQWRRTISSTSNAWATPEEWADISSCPAELWSWRARYPARAGSTVGRQFINGNDGSRNRLAPARMRTVRVSRVLHWIRAGLQAAEPAPAEVLGRPLGTEADRTVRRHHRAGIARSRPQSLTGQSGRTGSMPSRSSSSAAATRSAQRMLRPQR